MKILVIDNGTSYIRQLKRLLAKHNAVVVPWNRVKTSDLEKFQLVILSGGHKYPILNHKKVYKKETEIIKNCKTPLIGICLGSELIAYVFGSRLKRLQAPEHGLVALSYSPSADLPSVKHYKVYESHRWAIQKLGAPLLGLAKSRDGYEIFRHKIRPIYGLQFHPEITTPRSSGKIIFNRLLKTLAPAKN